MTLPSWTVKLAAAAVIPLIVGAGVAMSAPSLLQPEIRGLDDPADSQELGVDLAAVTGPTVSEVGKSRTCNDPSWPIVPFSCRDTSSDAVIAR